MPRASVVHQHGVDSELAPELLVEVRSQLCCHVCLFVFACLRCTDIVLFVITPDCAVHCLLCLQIESRGAPPRTNTCRQRRGTRLREGRPTRGPANH